MTFCNPVNIVQTTFINNRAGNALDESPAALAERYAAGERIDIEAYRGLIPNGCHQEVKLQFVRTAVEARALRDRALPPAPAEFR